MLTCSHQEAQILIVSAGFTSLPDILQVELSHINPLSTAIYNKTIVSPNNNSKNLSSWNSRKQSRDLPWLAKMAMLHQHKPTACQSWRLMQIAKFLPECHLPTRATTSLQLPSDEGQEQNLLKHGTNGRHEKPTVRGSSPPPMLGTPHFSLNEALIMPLVMRRSPSLCCMERAAGEDAINLHIFCRDVGLLVLWLCQKTPLLFGIDFLFWPLLFSGLVKPRYLVTASISVCIQLMEFFCALYCYRLWIGSAFNTAFPHYPCEGENSYGPCFKAGKQSTNIKYQMTTKKGRLCWDLHRFYLCNTAKCWAHMTSRKK